MLKNWTKIGRNRPELILESEESTSGTPSDGLSSLDRDVDDASRRASEPTLPTRNSAYQSEVFQRPRGPQHNPTSGSFFSTFGSQLGRRTNDNDKDRPLQDYEGLSLVHDCENPIADLIFVHGLGGSSKRTWSWERDVKNFWPPWLGSEVGFSNTRILTFGYNAHFAKEDTGLSVLDFAKDLLFQVRTYANDQKEDDVPIGTHPMIFVAHSMGGLVVKKAYIIGKTDEQFADMVSQTYAIVFLGTPHRGSNLASTLNNILRASPSFSAKLYISELKRGSTPLSDINEQFRNLCDDLVLVSFHETLKTNVGPTKAVIVEKDSAVLGYPGEISAPLRADHHGLTKYRNREDANYRDVRNILRSFLRKIREMGNPVTGLQKLLGPVNSTVSIDQMFGIEDMTESLDTFKQRLHSNGCRWILQKSSFRDWTEGIHEDGSNIYWLSGPPAIGKTTLSSFIISYLKQGFVPGTCQYHYFEADHHNNRTISYFLRSLAFQIAQQHEQFQLALALAHQNTGMIFDSQKYQLIWDKVFEGILFRIKFKEPIFWVLDGIDEAEAPGILAELMTTIASATPIRILLVSRPTKELYSALSSPNCRIHHEEIEIQDTAEDIHTHVCDAIARIIPDTLHEQRAKVIENILSRANGSFLWVKLALERIRDNWYTPKGVQKALDDIPDGMDTMYTRMMQDVLAQGDTNRQIAMEILTWASCAFRPLDLEELAVALDDKFHFDNIQSLEAAISHICGNFIVVKNTKVCLVHQTARIFLLQNETSQVPMHINRSRSNAHIALVCMRFLSNAPRWRSKFAQAQDVKSNSDQQFAPPAPLDDPFLWYATEHWAYHVNCSSAEAEKSKELQRGVFEFLDKHALIWINAVALNGNLRILTRSAANLKSWAKRRAHHASETVPISLSLSNDSEEVEVLLQWANDLIRIVGRFGAYLADNPASIHHHIVPFCPHDSMLYRTYQLSSGGSISVKGISSGRWDDCLARLTMGGDERASIIVAKDDYFMTLLSISGTIIVWHTETCEESRRLNHQEYVTKLKASRTSNLLATAGTKTIRVWDIVSGEEVYRLPKTSQGRIMSLAFTSNDTELLVAYDDCTVQCLGLSSTEEQWVFLAEDPAETEHSCPRLMTFSPDAKKVAIAYRGRPVFVWRITRQRGQKPMRCIRRQDKIKKAGDVWNSPEIAVWQPNSAHLLILYQDTILVDWNLESNSQTEFDHLKAREMAVSSDGNLLLTSNVNGALSVWTTEHFRLVYELAYDDFVRDIAFSPDAQRLYDVRGTMCNVWEPDALIRSDDINREDISTHESTLYSNPVVSADDNDRVQISALLSDQNDQYFCIGKEDGSVNLFEIETGKQHRKLYSHSSSVSVIEVVWSSSQKYIASVDDSGRMIAKRLEKPANKQVKWKVSPLLDFKFGTTVSQLLFSASEEFLLVVSDSWDRVYSTRTKQNLFQVARQDKIQRRWVQHPTNPALLLFIKGGEQALYRWSDLALVSKYSESLPSKEVVVKDDITPPANEPLQDPNLETDSTPVETLVTPENIFLLQDRYLVLDSLSNNKYTKAFGPTASRYIAMMDLEGHKLVQMNLPNLAKIVNRLIGVAQGHLVFLDHQYWICTWSLDGGDNGEQTKHFFLPKDWLSPGALRLITCNQYGTLLCPKNGEIAVVRYGIRI